MSTKSAREEAFLDTLDLGYSFAECHHTVPIAELAEDYRTRLADLSILCANCHRMIHKSKTRPLLTVKALRAIIESQHQGAKTQPSP